MRDEMLKNNNRFDSEEQLDRIRVRNGYPGALSYLKDLAKTYGFDY